MDGQIMEGGERTTWGWKASGQLVCARPLRTTDAQDMCLQWQKTGICTTVGC